MKQTYWLRTSHYIYLQLNALQFILENKLQLLLSHCDTKRGKIWLDR